MATVIRDDIVLCVCCAFAAAYGERSGCEDGSGHVPHVLSSPDIEGYIVVGESWEDFSFITRKCYGCKKNIEYGETVFDASVLG